MREMHIYSELTHSLEALRVSLLLGQTPADADHTDQVVLLPDALRMSLENLRLWEIARLAEQLLVQGRLDQIRRLCRVLAETLCVQTSPFCLHLLAMLCQAGNGSAAFKPDQRAAWIATGQQEFMLLAWISDLPARKMLTTISLDQLFSSLHQQLNLGVNPSPCGVIAHFHLLADILRVLQEDQNLGRRLREMPLTHTLLSQFYQFEEAWLPFLPEFLEFCAQLSGLPRLAKVYGPIKALLEEWFSLQMRQQEVRREWEKPRKNMVSPSSLVYNWIESKQDSLSLRLGSLRAWICLSPPPVPRQLPFQPVKALEDSPHGIPAHMFMPKSQAWKKDLRKLNGGLSLVSVYHLWQERIFSKFQFLDGFPTERYTSLFIEDGEFSWLFLVWALFHWQDPLVPFKPLPTQICRDFPSPEQANAVAKKLTFSTPEALLGMCELLPESGGQPSARFLALCDFLVREMYFKDENNYRLKANTLLPKSLRPLLTVSSALIENPKSKTTPAQRLQDLLENLRQAIQRPKLQIELKKLQNQGFFEWVLSEILLRQGDPAPRVFFLHTLISRRENDTGLRNFPVVLLSGQMIPSPATWRWPFVARRCAALLWPVVNRLNFALTDTLFMEQIEKQRQHQQLIAYDQRQSEQHAKITKQLNTVFQLERQLNNLLENVRQTVLPPAMALFSIGHWESFSQLFDDRKKIRLNDGSEFWGFHSIQNVDVPHFRLWMRWLEESLAPEKPTGFLKAFLMAWESSEQSPAIARSLAALLKLLCYDSLDPRKSLYWCQLLAALRAPGQEQERPYLTGVRREGLQIETLNTSLNASDALFLRWLSGEIAPQVHNYREPADSRWRFQISAETSAAQFLQSLAWLVHHALRPRPGGQDRVYLEQIQLNFEQTQGCAQALTLILDCQGQFEDPAIFNEKDTQLYHSTREHFQILAKALSGHEELLIIYEPSSAELALNLEQPLHPFLLLSSAKENRTRIVIHLKGEEGKIAPNPIHRFEDNEA